MKSQSKIWTHHFSHQMSQEVGIESALILRFLVDRIAASTRVADGSSWYGVDIENDRLGFPYLSRASFNSSLLALETAKLIRHSYLEGANAPTRRWYTTESDVVRKAR